MNTDNISASLEFLRDVTEGAGKSIIERCLTDEKLLETAILDELPDEHKPDDEYIASRLKVHNEFRTRLAARVQRKLKRTKKHGFYNPGDEMWMHFKPEPEELLDWRGKTRDNRKEHTVEEEAQEDAVKLTDEEEGTGAESREASGDESQDNWLGAPPSLRTDDQQP